MSQPPHNWSTPSAGNPGHIPPMTQTPYPQHPTAPHYGGVNYPAINNGIMTPTSQTSMPVYPTSVPQPYSGGYNLHGSGHSSHVPIQAPVHYANMSSRKQSKHKNSEHIIKSDYRMERRVENAVDPRYNTRY